MIIDIFKLKGSRFPKVMLVWCVFWMVYALFFFTFGLVKGWHWSSIAIQFTCFWVNYICGYFWYQSLKNTVRDQRRFSNDGEGLIIDV